MKIFCWNNGSWSDDEENSIYHDFDFMIDVSPDLDEGAHNDLAKI